MTRNADEADAVISSSDGPPAVMGGEPRPEPSRPDDGWTIARGSTKPGAGDGR